MSKNAVKEPKAKNNYRHSPPLLPIKPFKKVSGYIKQIRKRINILYGK